MTMMPFYSRFRDLAFREMRSVVITNNRLLPDGQYGFLEFYCIDYTCDCRRVLFHVVRDDTDTKVWASINFGWETVEFYRRWYRGDPGVAAEMVGATLDPLSPQTEHSFDLLELFRQVLLKDAAYVQRLSRHYRMFKSWRQSEQVRAPGTPQRTGRPKRRRRGG